MFRNTSLLFFTYILLNTSFCSGCAEHEVEGKSEPSETSNTVTNDLRMVCYYGSWSVYRPGDGKFPVEQIDPFLCSHLIYSFAGLGNDNRIRPLDPYNDLKENYGKGAYMRFNALKNVNKKLKTLIAIGGWNEGSIKYSNMASQPETRRIFIDSVIEFLGKYGFDGLDLDWEYPASRGGKPDDKKNLVALLRELKEAFAPKGYLLTSAVSAGKWNIDPAYDIPAISQYLDFINIMCYDYHGGWENKTGHNAPLYARPDEILNDKISNVNFSINYWISKGAPKSKIVLGMGTYGRSFTLQRAENHGLGAPAPQKGQAGPYTREAGSLGYNEICEMKSSRKEWTEVRDPYHLSPYAFSDRLWVGFDDIESISLKAQYIKAMQLSGGMIWSIETDDFRGKCGEKYPLLNAINKVFKSDSVVMPLPVPQTDSSASSTPSTPSTKPWVTVSKKPITHTTPHVKPSTTRSTTTTTTSTTTTTTTTPHPTTSTRRPRPSSTSSPKSSVWWSPSSSSTTAWPWAPTHPPHHGSSQTKAEEMTPTSTTTSKPSTPGHEVEDDSNQPITCTGTGIHKHQKDCQKFYRCVLIQMPNVYKPEEFNCPATLVFNQKTGLCDWVENVPECAKRVPKHFFRFNTFRN